MILVTGGCFQGKKAYACETFGIFEKDAVDGATCSPEAIRTARLLYHFHEYVRRMMQEGWELDVDALTEQNPELILVTNELGCGVVPVDRFDREYRERVGRLCCEIAGRCSQVHRVMCGLGTVIKDG